MLYRTGSRAAADTRVAWLQITSWGSSEMPDQDDFPSLGGFSAPGGPAPSQAQPRPTGAWGTGGLTSSKPPCKASVNEQACVDQLSGSSCHGLVDLRCRLSCLI